MNSQSVKKAIIETLKERNDQSTTSIVRNTKLDKRLINAGISDLRREGVIKASPHKNGRNNGHTWGLARDKDSIEYKMMTKKWDLNIFS